MKNRKKINTIFKTCFDLTFFLLRVFVVNQLFVLKNSINHEALRFTKNTKVKDKNLKSVLT